MPDAVLPPLPEETALTAFYWEALRAHRLELLRCATCGHFQHPPDIVCNRCQSTELAPEPISGQGTLYSYTTVVRPGHPFYVDRVPYLLGLIDIAEEPGVHIPAGLVECEPADVRCGMPMEPVFRELVPGLTLAYFRPRSSS